ncbi:hypothetical protein LJB93_01125 [Desulfovibrio sp. OttesenSCG-928-F07]|nr:hypothetical protein [Desulfovibrio sp. OttesenSCG-928-F07]
MKKSFGTFAVLAAVLMLALPVVSQASPAFRANGPHHMGGYGPGYGQGMGPGMGQAAMPGWQHPAIAPEKQAAYEKIINSHIEKVAPMQEQLAAKYMELEYLSRNQKTEPKAISALVNEVQNLKGKLNDQCKTSAATLQKELGIESNHAYALLQGAHHGRGNFGYGMGHGQRHNRGHW